MSSTHVEFQPPPTQNTAPVLEHRCLYTHDLRRKAKRWQDGILKFHTFNKRVMVYDMSRNYIGDSHWRQNDAIEDGDEFELDRGVLIQVGELVSSIQQDLTELLDRRKTKANGDGRTGSGPQATPISRRTQEDFPRPSSVLLQPKPLGVVLGASPSLHGRTSISGKSPFDVRREKENLPWPPINRAAKRLKLDKKPAPPIDIGSMSKSVSHGFSGNSSSNPISIQEGSSQRAAVGQPVLPDARDTSDLVRSRRIRRQSTSPSRSFQCAGQAPETQPKPNSKPRPQSRHTSPAVAIESSYDPQTKEDDKMHEPERGGRDETNDREISSEAEHTKLKLACSKPRKKLMYRALLPSSIMARDCQSTSKSIVLEQGMLSAMRESSRRLENDAEGTMRQADIGPVHRDAASRNPDSEALKASISTERMEVSDLKLNRDVDHLIRLERGQSLLPVAESAPQQKDHGHNGLSDDGSGIDDVPRSIASYSPDPSNHDEDQSQLSLFLTQQENLEGSADCAEYVEIPSSFPEPQTQGKSDNPHDSPDIQKSQSSPTPPTVEQLQHQRPNAKGSATIEEATCPQRRALPNFKPLAMRTPSLQKSVSDTAVLSARPHDVEHNSSEVDRKATRSFRTQKCTNTGVYPWSREAWDLFGCGRNGVAVTFKEFIDVEIDTEPKRWD